MPIYIVKEGSNPIGIDDELLSKKWDWMDG